MFAIARVKLLQERKILVVYQVLGEAARHFFS
jgi:hypothetical protein